MSMHRTSPTLSVRLRRAASWTKALCAALALIAAGARAQVPVAVAETQRDDATLTLEQAEAFDDTGRRGAMAVVRLPVLVEPTPLRATETDKET